MARQRRGGGSGAGSSSGSGSGSSSGSSRRGSNRGGFKPPELKGTLGTLLRTAAAQVGPLREALGDALERTAREGRSRVEDAISSARAGRNPLRGGGSARRSDAVAELGEIVLDLIRRGEIDIDELPEVHDVVAHLDELDDAEHTHAHAHGHPHSHSHSHSHDEDHDHDEPPALPPSRNRFDARGRDDGTVSSKGWAGATKSKSSGPVRVWRPPADDDERPDDERPGDEVTARERPAARGAKAAPDRLVPLPKDPLRKGGISFDDDEDLADYMHPDDVPPKGSSDGDS